VTVTVTAPVAKVKAASKGLRSMVQAHENRNILMNGADMCGLPLPVGPYETEEHITEAVRARLPIQNQEVEALENPARQEKARPASYRASRGLRRLLLCDSNRPPKPSRSKSDL
jgi:hypothetical protein